MSSQATAIVELVCCNFCHEYCNLLGWISDWFLTEDEGLGRVYIFDDSNFEYLVCINHSEHWHAPRPQSCGTTKTCHITPFLASLLWLKIKERIEYKLLSLTYKILTTSPATSPQSCISPVQSPRGTRTSSIAIRHTVPTRITKFGQLILRKTIKIVATRCQILRLKCTKFDFGWGSASDPAGGAYSAPQSP